MARSPMLLRGVAWLLTVVVAVAAAGDLFFMDALEADAQGSQEVLNLAGRQRMLSQRVAQLSLRLAQPDTDRAALTLNLSQALTELHDGRNRLVSLPFFKAHPQDLPDLAPLDAGIGDVLRASSQDATQSAALQLAQLADQFLPSMDAAVRQLQARAEHMALDARSAHLRQMAGLALFVVVVAIGLSELLARRIARQSVRSRSLVAELERLALVAERTYNAVIISDRQGRVVWANEAFTRISEYPLAEVLGKKPGTLLQFERTNPATRRQIAQALSEERPIQVEILNRAKGGRTYWLLLDIQPIRDLHGQCTGFSAVETDITPQVLERERLATLLNALPAGVVEQDRDGRITSVNPEACRILGLSQEQLLGLESVDPRWQTVHEDGTPFPGESHPAMRALRDGEPQRGVMMGVALPQGEMRWIRINAEPLKSSIGAVLGVVSSFVDVTDASSQRRLLNLTVQAAGLGTWDWWLKTGEVRFNRLWWEMLGYQPGDLPATSETWESLVHPDDLGQTKVALEQHLKDGTSQYQCEFRMRRADGTWTWIMAAGAVIERLAGGEPLRMAGIHLDIHARKALEQRLSDAALTDTLTGLPNRAALKARLAACAAQAKRDPSYRYAVLFMDFDRFKQINDTLGHEAGDELLRQISARLRTTLRPSDDLARLQWGDPTAARLGGDEFVALLAPVRQPGDAKVVAQRLLEALAQPYRVAEQDVHSTVSIGIAQNTESRSDPDELLRNADVAMYEAKRRGRGQFVEFVEGMGSTAS